MPRLFTLPEAESLLPRIEAALRAAVEHKPLLQAAEAGFQDYVRRINVSGGSLVNLDRVSELQSQRQAEAKELKAALHKLEQLGVEVKDLDMGLVDFPTQYRGRMVYLCWKLGEQRIGYWHSTDEGFAGRRPIDDEFRMNHQGNSPE